MKKIGFFLAILAILAVSCKKQSQSELQPHQTVSFGVGSDFEIRMPGALPNTIKMISLSGNLQPLTGEENISLVFLPKGSEFCDTIAVGPNVKIDNLNPMYFRYIDGKNVLVGRILVNHQVLKNILFSGNLSFIYQ
jgi:hypothetical protein